MGNAHTLISDGKMDLTILAGYGESHITLIGEFYCIAKQVAEHPSRRNLLKRASKQFGLDFDDAYQYTAAEKFGLQIMS